MSIFGRIDEGMTTGSDAGCAVTFVVAAALAIITLSGIIVWLLTNAPIGG